MDTDSDASERSSPAVEAMLTAYNTHQLIAITNCVPNTINIDVLPLARIKRIMKQDSCDPHPRMVSADTIPLAAYAAQLFIGSITSLAWQLSTSPGKRNTLQVKDLKNVVHSARRFDFLIDVLDMYEEQQLQQQAQEQLEYSPQPSPQQSPQQQLRHVNMNPPPRPDASLMPPPSHFALPMPPSGLKPQNALPAHPTQYHQHMGMSMSMMAQTMPTPGLPVLDEELEYEHGGLAGLSATLPARLRSAGAPPRARAVPRPAFA